MDEMQALRELRGEVEPASPRRMAALRAGLFRSMTTAPPRRRFGLPKLAWRIGLAGGLAVAMLVGVTVTQGGWFRPDSASASVFLERAATTLAAQPSPRERPRDDQWLYTKKMTTNVTIRQELGDGSDSKSRSDREVDVVTSEGWFRFDGTAMAGYDERGKLRQSPIDLTGDDERYPAQVWNMHAALPLDPDKVLAAVHAEVKRIYPDNPEFHHGQGLDERTIWLIGALLGEDPGLVPAPEQQAALYRALAKVPGLTITRGVTDLAGREGVLLSRRTRTFEFGIVIDPDTYGFLGTASRVENGKVVEGTSLLRSGMVDSAGERP
ncbi:CU044_5270 family protein [Flindersiella endophytica]